jgi:hypothetical protein
MVEPTQAAPFEPTGFWEVPHLDHARSTRRLLAYVKAEATKLEAEESAFAVANPDTQFLWRHRTELLDFLNDLTGACELYSYLAVEAFLNHYGIVRLGERFFRRNIERLPPAKKMAVILASTEGVLLDPTSPLYRLTEQMFQRRNELVHPKSRNHDALTIRQFAPFQLYEHCEPAVIQMEEFFRGFAEHHTSGFPLQFD